jgi:hypothetical protein
MVEGGWLVLPDRPEASPALSGQRHDALLRHASGRPWLVGAFDRDELTVASVGSLRVAVIGTCPVTATRLGELLAPVRTRPPPGPLPAAGHRRRRHRGALVASTRTRTNPRRRRGRGTRRARGSGGRTATRHRQAEHGLVGRAGLHLAVLARRRHGNSRVAQLPVGRSRHRQRRRRVRRALLAPHVDWTAMFAMEDLLGCETWLRAIHAPPTPPPARRNHAALVTP